MRTVLVPEERLELSQGVTSADFESAASTVPPLRQRTKRNYSQRAGLKEASFGFIRCVPWANMRQFATCVAPTCGLCIFPSFEAHLMRCVRTTPEPRCARLGLPRLGMLITLNGVKAKVFRHAAIPFAFKLLKAGAVVHRVLVDVQ
jgi:hypothetical protein